MTVRARLTLWYAGVLAAIIVAFSLGVFLFVRARLYGQLEAQLDRDFASVEGLTRHNCNELKELEEHSGIAFFQVLEGGKVVHRTAAWDRAAADPSRYRVRSGTAELAGRTFAVDVAQDESPARNAVRTLGLMLLLAVPCALAVALAGGTFLAGRVLAPVGAMAAKAKEITAERLSERLPVENPRDEFGRLATVMNETLTRLQNSFEQLRRFTADASHELRTPLTAIRSVGEVALQSPRDAAAYRDVIGSMLEEVDRLSRLVESLLVLTRADAGVLRPAPERLDLGGLARSVADTLRVLAEEKGQALTVEASEPVAVRADPAILRQAVTNLVDNAIKYTPAKGRIRIAVRATPAGEGALEVSDTGPGIPAEHRARIFERFTRIDSARSRDDGGVGLGLAIARWAVEVNGGRIDLETEEGKGSTFRIVLPAVS